tara:strand:- start:81 stop:485 length:405 start_codon:yes stop_codon:yes gene_type:complete
MAQLLARSTGQAARAGRRMAPFYSEFSDLPIDQLRAFLDEYDQPFDPSQLYSPAAEAKYVDTGQRVSEFRAIVDAECFGLAEELVAAVNRNQTSNVCRHSSDQRPVLCAPWLSDLCTPFCAPRRESASRSCAAT